MNEQETNIGWETIGFVGSSQYREAALMQLAQHGAATPSQLSERMGYDIASISHALRGLRDRDLIELLVDEDRQKGRYYGATDNGEAVADMINREVA